MIPKRSHGFLTIAAAIIIVFFALISAFLASIFIRFNAESSYTVNAVNAESLAESAIETGNALSRSVILSTPTSASRQTCAGLTAYSNASNTLASGDIALTPTLTYQNTTLSTGFLNTATPTTLTVADTSVFSPNGRVWIGREVFAYTSILNATTLGGVTRAQDNSMASTYNSGTLVSQYQCALSGTGSAPDATTPFGQRTVEQTVQQPMLFAAGDSGSVFNWNPTSAELQWAGMGVSPAIAAISIRSISALNPHDAWFVGNLNAATYQLGRLQGNSWTSFTFNPAGNIESNLNGIYATSANEAWAVGNLTASGNNLTLLRWINNGANLMANWCVVPTAVGSGCTAVTRSETGVSNNQKILFAVKAIDTTGNGYADTGYATGGQAGTANSTTNRGIVMAYNGASWALLSPVLPANNSIGQLFGLDITPPSGLNKEAFFVGQSSNSASAAPGVLIRYRNSVATISHAPTQILKAVSVIDTSGDGLADFGCAVGNAGLVVTFNSTMAITSSTTLTGSPNLTGVVVISPTNIWAVGAGGVVYHYDGVGAIGTPASWISLNTGITAGRNLNGVTAIFPQSPMGPWSDVVN